MADNQKIVTQKFRAGFISIFKATSMRNADGTTAPAKYSIKALFPPGTDMTSMKKAAAEAMTAKWGTQPPKNLRSPFRKNGELDNPTAGLGPDGDEWIVCTFSAQEGKKPGIVDVNREDIIDEAEIYSGAWYRAQVRAFAYEKSGNRGVSFGLENVQKVKDDEPIGSGRMPAAKAFEAVDDDDDSGKGAAGLFD